MLRTLQCSDWQLVCLVLPQLMAYILLKQLWNIAIMPSFTTYPHTKKLAQMMCIPLYSAPLLTLSHGPHRMFNLSLRIASIPDDWRSATVSSIFKKATEKMQVTTAEHQSFIKSWNRSWIRRWGSFDPNCSYIWCPAWLCSSSLLLTEQWVTELMNDGETVDMDVCKFIYPSV